MANVIPNVGVSRRCPPPFGNEGKLDGSNYTLWKFKIKAILNSYELLQTATGDDRMPHPTVSADDPAITIPPDLALLTAWQRRDADILCAILTSVSDSILPLIQYVSNAAEAWQILQNQYEMRNQTWVQNLENQLAAEKFADGEVTKIFITRIKNLRDQMAAISIGIESRDLARRRICVLPPRYDSLVTSVNTQVCVPPLSFEEFCSILQEEEMQQKLWGGGDSAFIANTKGKGKGVVHHHQHNITKRVRRRR